MKSSKRNPSGLATSKPIALRLMPAELANAERIADELQITRSNLARQAYLAGLPIVTGDLSSPSA